MAGLERDAELAVRFVGSREGRRLNRDFRRKDYATDVLTFAYAMRPIVQADIVICMPVVRRAAAARGKTVKDHLAHLVVHATLHAQGHTHKKSGAAHAMEAREIEILRKLRKPNPYK